MGDQGSTPKKAKILGTAGFHCVLFYIQSSRLIVPLDTDSSGREGEVDVRRKLFLTLIQIQRKSRFRTTAVVIAYDGQLFKYSLLRQEDDLLV